MFARHNSARPGPGKVDQVLRWSVIFASWLRLDAVLERAGAPVAAALLAVGSAIWPTSASAQFQVCNQSFDVFNLAIGQEVGETFRDRGLVDDRRQSMRRRHQGPAREPLRLRLRHRRLWSADPGWRRRHVHRSEAVRDRGIESCWASGLTAGTFMEVDTQAVTRWTLFLSPGESPVNGERNSGDIHHISLENRGSSRTRHVAKIRAAIVPEMVETFVRGTAR